MTCVEERMRRGLAALASGVSPRLDSAEFGAGIVRSVRRCRVAIMPVGDRGGGAVVVGSEFDQLVLRSLQVRVRELEVR